MYGFFTTIGCWEDLVGFYRRNASRTEIAHFSSDQTGTDVAFTHILSAQDLPPIASVITGSFVVTREQHFDPFHAPGNQAVGRYRAQIPLPLRSPGTTSCATPSAEAGCGWTVRAGHGYRHRQADRAWSSAV